MGVNKQQGFRGPIGCWNVSTSAVAIFFQTSLAQTFKMIVSFHIYLRVPRSTRCGWRPIHICLIMACLCCKVVASSALFTTVGAPPAALLTKNNGTGFVLDVDEVDAWFFETPEEDEETFGSKASSRNPCWSHWLTSTTEEVSRSASLILERSRRRIAIQQSAARYIIYVLRQLLSQVVDVEPEDWRSTLTTSDNATHTSAAELFYLHHVRSCAAVAGGARSTSNCCGSRKVYETTFCSRLIQMLLVKLEVMLKAFISVLGEMLGRCLAKILWLCHAWQDISGTFAWGAAELAQQILCLRLDRSSVQFVAGLLQICYLCYRSRRGDYFCTILWIGISQGWGHSEMENVCMKRSLAIGAIVLLQETPLNWLLGMHLVFLQPLLGRRRNHVPASPASSAPREDWPCLISSTAQGLKAPPCRVSMEAILSGNDDKNCLIHSLLQESKFH